MRYDVPVVATNTQTGQRVPVDLQAVIQQAVNQAVAQNKDQLAIRAQRAIEKAVTKESDEIREEIEGSFTGGIATTRTFIQGAAIDIGAAVLAVLATMIGPDTNLFDKELWAIVAVMMVKTVIQTGISYTMRLHR
jgi:hypothetical protein